MRRGKVLVFTPGECSRYHDAYAEQYGKFGGMIVPWSDIPDYSDHSAALLDALKEAREYVEMAVRIASVNQLDETLVRRRAATLAKVDAVLTKATNQAG